MLLGEHLVVYNLKDKKKERGGQRDKIEILC